MPPVRTLAGVKSTGKQSKGKGKGKGKGKTGDPACSAAMSEWVLGRATGDVSPETYKILAECRAKGKNARRSTPTPAGSPTSAGSAGERVKRAKAVIAKPSPALPSAKERLAAAKSIRDKMASSGSGSGSGGVGSKLVAAHADVAGETPTVKRKRFADETEQHVAKITGGRWLPGNEPSDVDISKPGGGLHRIEVKSKSFGGKENLSVHTNALYLKAKDAIDNPGNTWHTVAIDARHDAEGGAHRAKYSGHDLYYKRAVGAYALKDMYKVKNVAELNRLIKMTDKELPLAARGTMPKKSAVAAMAAKADKERAYNNARSKERKARLGRAAYRTVSPQS